MSVLLCGNAMIVLLYYYCLNNYFVSLPRPEPERISSGSLTICVSIESDILKELSHAATDNELSNPFLFFPCSSHHSHIFLIRSKSRCRAVHLYKWNDNQERSHRLRMGLAPISIVGPFPLSVSMPCHFGDAVHASEQLESSILRLSIVAHANWWGTYRLFQSGCSCPCLHTFDLGLVDGNFTFQVPMIEQSARAIEAIQSQAQPAVLNLNL